ncbi:MAG: Trk family potassium uptake protein, partial [Faecalibacterium sp.]|nr:Trk family potassium uptake protein [Faecalibacterium sp.]
MKSILKKLSSFQIILLGFAGVILTGTILLMLPLSTAGAESAKFSDALFTSVSAVCVTGLITQDTATYWSMFGQAVILLMIQIGGLGVVSSGAAIAWISGRRINLRQRSTMQEAVSAQKVGGVVKFTVFIFLTTFIIEMIGCLLMLPVFCREFGFLKGLWYSVFHSISAFCNAGFDLMGVKEQFSSLSYFSANPLL